MSEKIEFCFLTNHCNQDILCSVITALIENGWSYNEWVPGEYTYWVNGPIWEFGESVTVEEKCLGENTKLDDIHNIIAKLSKFYSPSIMLGKRWFNNSLKARIAIFEQESEWREVKFSVDRYIAYESLDASSRKNAALLFRDIFSSIAHFLNPYYGLGATEIAGVVSNPNALSIKELHLGDYNYFSPALSMLIDHNTYLEDYDIQEDEYGGKLLWLKNGLLELGN